ncbi:MAG TPA: DUF1080 domain-containing protein [Gemmatimonadaceae bacterium]|nr:DUF1080 domain-containing protein [Gemmatimonadaceae bacterium]
MRTRLSMLVLGALGAIPLTACAQQPTPQTTPAPSAAAPAAARQMKPEETEVWTPVPPVVTPGAYVNTTPPSDAVVLFNGTSLDEWVMIRDKSPAKWTLGDGVMTVNKAAGGIETKRQFTDYQMHIEWRVPTGTTQTGQSRGNSGIFLASTGSGDTGYELQVLDSYENKTYVNGQAASIYKQSPPLVNAMRKQGEWNVYDIVWTAPRFNADGSLKSPARITVLHNGVLVQNNYTLKGHTPYIGLPEYKAHGPAPIKLQSHGDPSPPISFKNIWVRPL